MASTDERAQPGVVSTAVACRLIMTTPAKLSELSAEGWVQPVGRGQWRTVEVVQGYIRRLQSQDTVADAEAMAALLDVSTRRVKQMADEGIMVRAPGRNQFERDASVKNYVRYLRDGSTGAGRGVADGKYSTERARLTRAKADMAETARLKMLGELVPASEIKQAWTAIVSVLRTRLLAIPARVAPKLLRVRSIAEAADIVRKEINAALEFVAAAAASATEFGNRRGNGNGHGRVVGDPSAPAAADDLSVG